MLSEREQLAADKEAEAQGLQRHLAQLLGMPQADVPMLHRARFGAHARIAALEVRGAWNAGKAACMSDTGFAIGQHAFDHC